MIEETVSASDEVEKYATNEFFLPLLERFSLKEEDSACLRILYSVLDNISPRLQRKMLCCFRLKHVCKLLSVLEPATLLELAAASGHDMESTPVYSATILNYITKLFRSTEALTYLFTDENIVCLLRRRDWFVEKHPGSEQTDELERACENLKAKIPGGYERASSRNAGMFCPIPEAESESD